MKNLKTLKPVYKVCFLLVIGLLTFENLTAQNNTSSPYSYYGLGELIIQDVISPTGMASLSYRNGGVLNVNNPAALSELDNRKFIFQVGMVSKFTNLTQGDKSDSFNDLNLSKIGFGFKASPKYGVAVSLSPYTSLGYNITRRELIEGGNDFIIRSQIGTGGLNQLVWSNGFKISKDLSFGVNGIYVFGNNLREESIVSRGGLGFTYNNETRLVSQGLHFNLGTQYKYDFLENSLMLGLKYQPKIGVRAKRITEVTNLGVERYNKTDRGSYDVPEAYGFSLGFNKGKQVWIGVDYLLEKWSETKKFDKNNLLLDKSKFSLATIYNSNDGYATKFLKKLFYRFGAYYDTGYIEVRDQRIKTKGISFGIGMPLARGNGMINLSFELGQMGSTGNSIVREDFGRVNLEINLFESWFFKRKYH